MRQGRFDEPANETAQLYSESVSIDWRLYPHDIKGSLAHAKALAAAGILTKEEHGKIEAALTVIEAEIKAGDFRWERTLEDVHMNIEAALTKRIGPAGAKLHTARSRNDQVALDLRLYVKTEAAKVCTRLRELQRALLNLAERFQNTVLPGYTHLQRAQPIVLGHYFLAHVEALERDHGRIIDCARRADVLPLGSGAIAGSTIALDREAIARDLGFAKISQNSLDAVGDRDFVAEFLFGIALIGMHLSRFSEELVLWSTTEFGFITFSDAFSTGSSLMPQKKNPDMAELTRGKTGRLYGNLVALLTTLKGLPTSYQRDLQEDKGPLFDSVATVKEALRIFAAMLPEITVHAGRMENAAADPNLLATDLAEYLVKKGMPFREAHEAVGKLVTRSDAAKRALNDVSLLEMQEISPLFGDDVLKVFDVRASLAKRTAVGAPAPENVAAQIVRWKSLL
ncbi:MAG TPA: argininosuccinate lyase [Chthoniobacterales bacterium]|jgi:argininosuccinate lyase|nr:argininosuccinate lyase [Chthoniobacterales bacterium]